MKRKRDIKQFRQACREAGLTASERYEASQVLDAEKEAGGGQPDMSYAEPGCENGGTLGDRRSPSTTLLGSLIVSVMVE
jgi:hypothetical protein